jgi:uncharacterized membrane protein YccC
MSKASTLRVAPIIAAICACLACAYFLNPEMPDWLRKLNVVTGCLIAAGVMLLLKRDIEQMDAEIERLKAEEDRLRRYRNSLDS